MGQGQGLGEGMGEGMGFGQGQGMGQGQGQGQGQGMGQGMGQGQGMGLGQGSGGTGGKGMGRGGRPPEEPEDVDFVQDLIRGSLHKGGKVLTHGYVKGLPPKGEVRKQYAEIVAENKDSFDNPAELEKIPRVYRDTVRDYFEAVGATEAAKEDE